MYSKIRTGSLSWWGNYYAAPNIDQIPHAKRGAEFASELQAIDVNRDGYLDLVGASLYLPFEDKSLPVFVLLSDKRGSLKVNKTLIDSETTFPREIVVADFNGDGIKDMFIADHGHDAEPFPGQINTLLFGKAGGGFTDASSRLPRIKDFSHSADAADIDGDGDVDIYVGNINGGESGPYFLLNNGLAGFSKSTVGLPSNVLTRQSTHTTEMFIDIDSDGDKDLFLGGDGGPHKLLLNDGAGKSQFAPGTVPGGRFGANNTISLDVSAFDFDKNGKADILVAGTKAVPSYDKSSLQVLLYDGAGKLADGTDLYFDNQPTSKGWIKYVHYADLNHDGALDIVGEMSGGAQETVAYLNDGNNRFYQMRTDALLPYGG